MTRLTKKDIEFALSVPLTREHMKFFAWIFIIVGIFVLIATPIKANVLHDIDAYRASMAALASLFFTLIGTAILLTLSLPDERTEKIPKC